MCDLEPGHHYQFRVSAVNSEGVSEFLASDGAILAKDPWGKYGQSCVHSNCRWNFSTRKPKHFSSVLFLELISEP